MKISIRKPTFSLSLVIASIATLVACGQNDQGQTVAVKHGYGSNNHSNSSSLCTMKNIAKDTGGLEVALAIQVVGDSAANMQSCSSTTASAAPTSPLMNDFTSSTLQNSSNSTANAIAVSTDDLSDMSATVATTTPPTTAQAAVAPAAAPSTPSTTPSSAATTTMSAADFATHLDGCSVPRTTPADGTPTVTMAQLIAQKKNGTYQLTNVVFVAGELNTSSQDKGLIATVTSGLIAATPAKGMNPDGVSETACGGWQPGHGHLQAKVLLPNTIRATDMSTSSRREDMMTASEAVVQQSTRIETMAVPLRNTKRQISTSLTSAQANAGIQTTFYQDTSGVVYIQFTQDGTIGNYHSTTTVLGTYTLKTN